ncbi:MAG: hypothetical protein WDW36_005441 [Sanguina aurantia]
MVQVYTEPLCRRHYSSLFGEAVICRLSILAISIALSLVVSYSTGGFWVKLKPDITQASVHYTYDAILVFEGNDIGQEMIWTSSPSINTEFGSKYVAATVQASEQDLNFDGKPDIIEFTATVAGAYPVYGVKALLQFTYVLKGGPLNLEMHSLAYLTHSSQLPGAVLYTDGELVLQQKNALTFGRYNDLFNQPMLSSAAPSVFTATQPSIQYEFQKILGSYLARNYTTLYTNNHPVWKAGNSDTFTLSMRIRIPPNQLVYYRPMVIEMLKGGWIQFLATFAVLWFLLSWAEVMIFKYRIVSTRVASDLVQKLHKF